MPVYSIDPYPLRAGRIYNPDTFVSIWDTTKTSTGSSNDNQIKLPLVSGGTYNFYVDWGDGTANTITAYNQAEVTHTYNYSGVYTIMITGTLTGFKFNNSGDRLKLLRVVNWGRNFCWGNAANVFYSCSNLIITALDALNLTGITTFQGLFSYCENLVSIPNINNWNVSAITLMHYMFANCTKFNQNLNNWNTANVTAMASMFNGDTVFNQDISAWNTGNVTDMSGMFQNAKAFNQNIGGWNTSKVANMSNMFNGATAFNQNLGSWNIGNLTNATNMFINKQLSTANYDALLIGWAAQAPNIKNGVPFHGGTSKYSDAAVAARNTLTSTYGWIITDGGHV